MEKKNRYIFKLVFFILVIVLLFSCNDEPNNYISISGLWRFEEIRDNGTEVYTVDICKSESDSTIFAVYNFYNFGNEEKIYIKVNSENEISIELQFIGNSGIFVEGIGEAESDYKNIYLRYTIDNGIKKIDVNSHLTRL